MDNVIERLNTFVVSVKYNLGTHKQEATSDVDNVLTCC